MERASKEEIARVDLAHRRADEAVAQRKAGHIIPTCDVLFEDENNGVRATWTDAELTNWERDKAQLVDDMHTWKEGYAGVAIARTGARSMPATSVNVETWAKEYQPIHHRARVMYADSAAYLAVHPKPDPYTKSDKLGTKG